MRWLERLELARVMCRNERNADTDDDAGETMVMRYLVPLIEQARWGIAPGGQFNFQRLGGVESTIITYLCIALCRHYPVRISEIMADTERTARLPPGSIIRLPP